MGSAQIEDEKRQRFEDLVFQHTDAIYRFLLWKTGNVSDAEDLIQMTYLRAYKFFDKLKSGTNFRAWLFKLTNNVLMSWYRTQARKPTMVEISSLGLAISTTPETEFFNNILDERLATALSHLPEIFRKVILLTSDGFSYQDIAKILDCPVGTVTSRLHRGRQILRHRLPEYELSVSGGKNALSEKLQIAFTLVVERGLLYREAAEVAGCSVGAIADRLYKARKILGESGQAIDG